MATNPYFINFIVALTMYYYGGDNLRKNCPHMTLDSDTKLIHDRDIAISELASVTSELNQLKNGQMSHLVDSLKADNYKYQTNLNNCINNVNDLEHKIKQIDECKIKYSDLEYNKKLFLNQVLEFNAYKEIMDEKYEEREKNLELEGECEVCEVCEKCPASLFEYLNLSTNTTNQTINMYDVDNRSI
tara:strand:- start:2467 stop:3027 length:561 start_codon:yes stop_codon:yes gene_type:complete